MKQTAIPYLFMRGGTSRGPFFHKGDLPQDRETLSKVLVSALGSGHELNIDGLGGGNSVTTKVAILSKSDHEWADIDYFFAQVSVLDGKVDYTPTCGNILSAVGPAAIEMGLHPITGETTDVKVRATNTDALVTVTVQTPNGEIQYDGDTAIDGVPGTAARIDLKFRDVAGAVTGKLLPTGSEMDTIDGIDVSCIDVAMPMVIARATDFGLTGHESAEELNANREFYARMEAIRCKAGEKMGLGDVSKSVVPKFGLVAPPAKGGTVAARYLVPWVTHPTMAATGSQCISSCVLIKGSVADGMIERPEGSPVTVTLEHPMGQIDVLVEYSDGNRFEIHSAGLARTARKLARGELYIPGSVWQQQATAPEGIAAE